MAPAPHLSPDRRRSRKRRALRRHSALPSAARLRRVGRQRTALRPPLDPAPPDSCPHTQECSLRLARDLEGGAEPPFRRVLSGLGLQWVPVVFSSGPVWGGWDPFLPGAWDAARGTDGKPCERIARPQLGTHGPNSPRPRRAGDRVARARDPPSRQVEALHDQIVSAQRAAALRREGGRGQPAGASRGRRG